MYDKCIMLKIINIYTLKEDNFEQSGFISRCLQLNTYSNCHLSQLFIYLELVALFSELFIRRRTGVLVLNGNGPFAFIHKIQYPSCSFKKNISSIFFPLFIV